MSEQAEAESVEVEPSPSPADTAAVIRPAGTPTGTRGRAYKTIHHNVRKKRKRACLVLPSYPVHVERTQ